jgi:hypothetical protein
LCWPEILYCHHHMSNITRTHIVYFRISLIEACCLQGSYWLKGFTWLSWSHHLESFTVATMTWLTVMEYLCHKYDHGYVPLVSISLLFPNSWLITRLVTRLTRRMLLVGQELLTFRSSWVHPRLLVVFVLLDL